MSVSGGFTTSFCDARAWVFEAGSQAAGEDGLNGTSATRGRSSESALGVAFLRRFCERSGFYPRFSIRPLRRGKGGRETDRQRKGLRAIPKTFHPLSLAHGDREFQDVFAAFGGGVTGLGKELVTEGLQGVLDILAATF